jgi:hypothetical protein
VIDLQSNQCMVSRDGYINHPDHLSATPSFDTLVFYPDMAKEQDIANPHYFSQKQCESRSARDSCNRVPMMLRPSINDKEYVHARLVYIWTEITIVFSSALCLVSCVVNSAVQRGVIFARCDAITSCCAGRCNYTIIVACGPELQG